MNAATIVKRVVFMTGYGSLAFRGGLDGLHDLSNERNDVKLFHRFPSGGTFIHSPHWASELKLPIPGHFIAFRVESPQPAVRKEGEEVAIALLVSRQHPEHRRKTATSMIPYGLS